MYRGPGSNSFIESVTWPSRALLGLLECSAWAICNLLCGYSALVERSGCVQFCHMMFCVKGAMRSSQNSSWNEVRYRLFGVIVALIQRSM